MILFKPEHVLLILGGNKTQTRRLGKKRWNVGSVHKCYTRPPFAKGGAEPFCRVRILGVRRELLLDITAADARAEGYGNRLDYLDAFLTINCCSADTNDLYMPVWVVTFAVAP